MRTDPQAPQEERGLKEMVFMQNITRRMGLWIPCFCAMTCVSVLAKEPIRGSAKNSGQLSAGQGVVKSVKMSNQGKAASPKSIGKDKIKTLKVKEFQYIGGTGSVSGAVLPTPVYLNEVFPPDGGAVGIYSPGVNQRLADDLELESTSGTIASYSFAVGGFATAGAATTFSVSAALWTGDPCVITSSVIPGSQFTRSSILNDGSVTVVEATLPSPITIPTTAMPGIIWMALTFDNADVGWVVALEAEIGYTRDLFSENETDEINSCVQLFFGGDPLAGFWAGVNANLPSPPRGACCVGATCSQTAELNCAGTWQGAFSSCTPNVCQFGACCDGNNFESCSDTNEVVCAADNGLFYPGVLCGLDTCPAQFLLYSNNAPTPGVFTPPTGNDPVIGDDIQMAAGFPCELSSLEATVLGFAFTDRFDAVIELWDVDPADGLPLMPIAGTRQEFTNLGDGAFHNLVAGPYSGIIIPEIFFMVVTINASSNETGLNAGWALGGMASIGVTQDVFFLRTAGVWSAVDFVDPIFHSGYQAKVSCYGVAPTGACCNDIAGTCIDDLTQQLCEGRWEQNATCAAGPDGLEPPCGSSACCIQNGCTNRPVDECDAFLGESAPGRFCADLDPLAPCPRLECTGATGDCLLVNGTLGCEDGFCCEEVCQADPFCCQGSWDDICVALAETLVACTPPPADDNCDSAIDIAGEGTFLFDNTAATTDGSPHAICASGFGDDSNIGKDVWRGWTAPRDGLVYVRTCGKTQIDTKLAVYQDVTCPPGDADLLFCNDDHCGFDQPGGVPLQSQLIFQAVSGQRYLIRIGVFPGSSSGGFAPAAGGTGAITISYDLPDVTTCPGTGDCCSDLGTGTPGCTDDTCCRTIAACDAFCVEVEWDTDCAGNGFGGTGCGAAVLCDQACGPGCPSGPVTFLNPVDQEVDARQPFPPGNPSLLQGVDTFLVEAPSASVACWTLCETVVDGVANNIANIIDHMDGTMTIELVRPISINAVTTLNYNNDLGTTLRGRFNSSPGNVNGDATVTQSDVSELMAILNMPSTPFNAYRHDIDHSGTRNAGDILGLIDLLNGAGGLPVQMGSSLPLCDTCCPR